VSPLDTLLWRVELGGGGGGLGNRPGTEPGLGRSRSRLARTAAPRRPALSSNKEASRWLLAKDLPLPLPLDTVYRGTRE
jgi:hypothetical protein